MKAELLAFPLENGRYGLALERHSSQKKKGQILAQQPLSNHVAKVKVKI
jgi:hypothetical protein